MFYKYCLLILALTSLGTAAQKVQGVGPFKIDITDSTIIDSIAKENSIKVRTSYDEMDTYGHKFEKSTSRIFVMGDPKKSDNPRAYNSKYSLLLAVRVYYINHVEVSGVALDNLYLSFYNGKLYDLECDGSKEISDALNTKYGQGDIKTEEKTISCRNGLGITYEEKETTFYINWPTATPGLSCVFTLMEYFDDHCKKQFLSFLHLYNQVTSEAVGKVQAKLREAGDTQKEATKKDKLKDF